MQEAAERAGAPKGLISCIKQPTLPATNELMRHKLTDVILATGGTAMVKAAYISGKPAYGVGPGNVPVYIHESANIETAVRQIIESNSFDYGTICASEQAIVVDQSIKERVVSEFKQQGAYFLDDNEKQKMASLIMVNGRLNAKIVGKSPQTLGEMVGIEIPSDTKVIIAEETNVGKEYPFSVEKLSPILAFYTVKDMEEASAISVALLELGGLYKFRSKNRHKQDRLSRLKERSQRFTYVGKSICIYIGHTLGIHAEDEKIVEAFTIDKPVSRVIVNSGTTFGGIGATVAIQPSLTLGCGSFGNNITSDNIGPQHLLNIKRVAYGIREMPKQDASTRKETVLTN
jgi:acetaldehyde dehydrogenase (acetylating)